MSEIAAGTVFGNRYIVQAQIGTGGMATVYRGVDATLDRQVAIKVMLSQYAGDASFAQRFRQEARAAAALQNPYIVQVYDWGKDEATGTYYIVMEYLRGTDLKNGIRSHHRLAPKKVAQIAAQVCSALAVAHSHDIIHRDIKPQNIMVLPNGDIKVMDFGIARAKNSHLTQTNSVLGTAHYVSPEQAQGKELGPTSDLYSLGIVMYEAVTGELPFEGDDAVSVALKQVNEQPVPPSRLNPNIDPSFEAIIMRLLAKDPSQRFQTADELRHVLNAYMQGKPVSIAPYYPGGMAASVARASGEYQPYQQTSRMRTNPAETTRQPPIRQSSVDRTMRMQTDRERQRQQQKFDTRMQKAQDTTRSMMIGIVAIVAILLILVIAAILVVRSCSNSNVPDIDGNISDQKTLVSVPDLDGLTEQQARNRLESYGLVVGEVSQEESTVAQGKIIGQTPAAGEEVEEGTAVDIIISGGASLVTFQDIRGYTVADATSIIEALGLTLVYDETLDSYSTDYNQGTIVAYSPSNQQVAKGSQVYYGLSKGPEYISIPNVSGWYYEDAQTTLSNSGFKIIYLTWQYNSDVSWGYVISTSPSSGSYVASNATITIYVSQGAETVSVGNYAGESLSATQSALESLGLNYETKISSTTPPSESLAGMVEWTDPSNTTVEKGTTVIIYVYGEYPYVEVPDYTGWSVSNAREDALTRSLSVTATETTNTLGSDFDNLVQSSTPTGTVNKGTTITLVYYGTYVAPVEPEPEPSGEGESGGDDDTNGSESGGEGETTYDDV